VTIRFDRLARGDVFTLTADADAVPLVKVSPRRACRLGDVDGRRVAIAPAMTVEAPRALDQKEAA
jgi:hypothetical protein